MFKYIITILNLLVFAGEGIASNFTSIIEKKIQSGAASSKDLIVSNHPRIWMKGEWDWNKDNYGSFAWRIVHGEPMKDRDPAHDQMKYEFTYCTCSIHGGAYSADNMFGRYDHDYGRRALEPIVAGKAVSYRAEWNFPLDLPSTSDPEDYSPDHTMDEYYTDAKEKLFYVINWDTGELSRYVVIYGSVAYDWLVSETLQNGQPVFSNTEKQTIQQRLIGHADYLKSRTDGGEHLFNSDEIHDYMYVMVGLALYEPSLVGDPTYASINAKAEQYLDDFDTYWVGKILPALNEQGGDGGWHGGMSRTHAPYVIGGLHDNSYNNVPVVIAPLLFAHYTATGLPIEDSIFSTGVLKYMIEFQNHMIRPDGDQYYPIGGELDQWSRAPWTFPRRVFARRRFSSNPEQQKLGELGGWIGIAKKSYFHIGTTGSWDAFDQLIFEDKWPNPRSPEDIGFAATRHFEKLGWVFMREGFTSSDDMAALFISQRYHWSELDPYSQNSFTLERKGQLIKGFQNTIYIDNEYQRSISNFPTITEGVEVYAPGSIYDVGPGIQAFESTDEYDYMIGDATNAYDSNKLEKFTRQIVYLKPDKFIIFDRVVTKSASYKKSWVIHPGASPQSVGDTLMLISNGTGALWIKRLLPDNVTQNLSSDLIEVTPVQPAEQELFLFVLQATDSNLSQDSPVVIADQAKLISEGDKAGVQLDQWEVLFNITGAPGVLINNTYTGIKKYPRSSSSPARFHLLPSYPNPFNPGTTISYDIADRSTVNLAIFDTLGRLVVTLVNTVQSPGRKEVRWDGRDKNGVIVSSGVYFVILAGKTYATSRKILLIR